MAVSDHAQIIDGVYYFDGKVITDPKMKEIIELMLNPPIYIKDFRPRSQKTMAQNFNVRPFDNFKVLHTSNCISDSIGLHVTNSETKESFYLGMKNKLDSWKLLKRIHEMGNREVSYQIDDNEPFPYHESVAYQHRFGKKAA